LKEPIRIELPTLHPDMTVNAYLFLHPEVVLVDCGLHSPKSWEVLTGALAKEGLTIQAIKKVYITHAHIDHMGLAGRIARSSDAEIWVNEYTYPWAVDVKSMWTHRAQMIEQVLRAESDPQEANPPIFTFLANFLQHALQQWEDIPLASIRQYNTGDQLSFGGGEWEAIYAPGHSNTQSCFYNASQKWLLSADMLLQLTPTPAIEMKIDQPNEREPSIITLLASFNQMKALDIKKVFPGHYEPFEDHCQVIDQQVARIHLRKEQSLRVIKKGLSSFFDIHQGIYKSACNIFTVSMLKGYLDLLELEQKVELSTAAGFRQYFAK